MLIIIMHWNSCLLFYFWNMTSTNQQLIPTCTTVTSILSPPRPKKDLTHICFWWLMARNLGSVRRISVAIAIWSSWVTQKSVISLCIRSLIFSYMYTYLYNAYQELNYDFLTHTWRHAGYQWRPRSCFVGYSSGPREIADIWYDA